MTSYIPTIGLEIHAELKTQTKMFCASRNDPDETRPNTNVCPVCMSHPGTLPTINKEAVRQVLTVGIALQGEIADYTEFDRKNYFYPDIPKGYQISQYKYPLVKDGSLSGVGVTRVHLEEDTARSTHESGGYSLVDFNRAGVPLMELVTEPVIHDARQASSFAKEFQLLLRTLGVSDANMEKGQMRVEANISVAQEGSKDLGTKVEVKNLNSFRSVERAIECEVKRQSELLGKGGVVKQETRGFDENKQNTFSQRAKEDSHDYRYFPDPDLPKLKITEISEFSVDLLKSAMPELPDAKRMRLREQYGIKADDVEFLVENMNLLELFETVGKSFVGDKVTMQLVANYIISDLVGLSKNDSTVKFAFTAEQFAELIRMVVNGDVSSRGAKDVLGLLYERGGSAMELAKEANVLQQSGEDFLRDIAEKIIRDNVDAVSEYRAGKEIALKYLVGQGMKETRGSANPQTLEKLLKESLR